ncbi:NADH:flavin oxidoreductase/NADH oxidase [Mesorhizobium sp. YR577]|uniref:NADH:flavin oxidoreductase/NADH oxidase n=1 Tax=Mesorhizobium sp. YR577 TaxID=1884373 RepID=UPI0008E69E35|nr:NADH:flavin oxidoreductase/NADH oxidase [Mesorhizobium sp. YR577]SFT89527.1 2,4-dienoyl-CoA reductase [Mesorhizobium sp. YR577]
MTKHLFSPITLGNLEFPNRIAVAPMCQYSADDGSATDWHLQHWMNLAMSGAGMVTVEMTDVERRGRITHGCLGLYSDHNEAAARRTLDAARRVAAPGTKFGVQLAHAGRKASNRRPWEGGNALGPDEDPWQIVSASAIAFDEGWQVPEALDEAGIERIVSAFADAAKRAARAGFDFIELHSAHGYLLHQFLSPLSNKRTDKWGGSLENRMRFPVEVVKAVVAAAPGLMVGARMSVTDWVEGGFDVPDAIEVAKAYKAAGAAYICCSSGGNSPLQKIQTGPGYQVHLATAIREGAGIPTRAVGLIDMPRQADAIITEGKADMVAVARALIADPRWPWRAAATLGHEFHPAPQLARGEPFMRHWTQAAE